MTMDSGDFELSMDELRVITRYAVGAAEDVLPAAHAARAAELAATVI